MKAQEAFMNKEQVDRALKSMRSELETTQETTETLRQEMLQCVRQPPLCASCVAGATARRTLTRDLLS